MPSVLALETSCDESAAALLCLHGDGRLEGEPSRIASQGEEHARGGGAVPEIASRRHVGALATGGLEVLATSPADATSDVEEHHAGDHEVAGMAPAAVYDQVGQAISAAHRLAVTLKTGLCLGCGSSFGTRLEAGVLTARGQASHIGMGHRGEAEEKKAAQQDGKESTHDGQGRTRVLCGD